MNKSEINRLFSDFNNLKVLIIGDVMIDAYYFGKVNRISPEAPVPVVSVTENDNRLGGAANVALNVKALGATPILCSVIGNDKNGVLFQKLMKDENLSTEGVVSSEERITTVKTRIIGNNHQMLRVDSEIESNLNQKDETAFIDRLNTIINNEKIDVVIFEDYDKGAITEGLINSIVSLCNSKNIPTTVDPKKRNFLSYKNVTLFKPNLKELNEGINVDVDGKSIKALNNAVVQLNNELSNQINFITLSENGVFIKNNNSEKHVAAHYRNITDVSGAGDTVISVASLCLALNLEIGTIAEMANLAGGLVCENVGVVPVDKNQLLTEAISKLI